jgi:1-acyl-sn-glycerol-3-phosphate acyltransferase
MRLLRRLSRIARLIPHILVGLWRAATILPRNRPPRGRREWDTVRRWIYRALDIVGVEVRVHGQLPDGPALVVSNHISWLDLGALIPVVDAGFIGKSELAHWPLLGFIIARGGTVFIDRRGNDSAARITREMIHRLQQGDRVAVFPEGMTNRGPLRRFHPRLFEAARATGVPIQPVALRYDNDVVPFVDHIGFLPHLWRVLGERRITVDVWLLDPILTGDRDRRSIARSAEAAVREQLTAASAATVDDGARSGQ